MHFPITSAYSYASSNFPTPIYCCNVQNAVNITLFDAGLNDTISGTHLVGLTNDNVESFLLVNSQVKYFPRGLNTIFKNLKAEIEAT